MILHEPGAERMESLLDAVQAGSDVGVAISSVNWCEVLTRLERENVGISGQRLSAVLSGVELIPFGKAEAEAAVRFVQVSRALSLGDRACLALAGATQATAWTTERLWARCKLDVPVELIRP
jgi:PIN domain nuclease of toxin-antitoxin system